MVGIARMNLADSGRRHARGRIHAIVAVVAVFASLCGRLDAAELRERHALLIGVGQYQAFKGKREGNLEGPPFDVAALRSALTTHWGFDDANVRVLVDAQATRQSILSAIDALGAHAKRGDQIFIYFSGHGTSALDSSVASLALSLTTGALVPYDWPGPSAAPAAQVAGLIIGNRDLRPRLMRLDETGADVLVVADACYSGQAVRSHATRTDRKLPERFIPSANVVLLDDLQASAAQRLAATSVANTTEAYPYRNVVYVSSAAEGERAQDLPARFLDIFPTVDMKPHGAMSDALLRVLSGQVGADFNRDGAISARELVRAVADFMSSRAYAHSPQLLPSLADDTKGVAHRNLFGEVHSVAKAFIKSASPAVADVRVRLLSAPAALAQQVKGIAGVTVATDEVSPVDVLFGVDRGRMRLLSSAGDLIADYPLRATDESVGALRQLAGAKRLRSIAEDGRHSVLPFEVSPSHFGGNFMVGQKLNFVVRPEAAAFLLILTVDSAGKWTTLYPQSPSEQRVLPVREAVFIPGERETQKIQVTLPLGMDLLFAFGFDAPIPRVDDLMRLEAASADAPRLERFLATLGTLKGKYAFNRAEIRTLPSLANEGDK